MNAAPFRCAVSSRWLSLSFLSEDSAEGKKVNAVIRSNSRTRPSFETLFLI